MDDPPGADKPGKTLLSIVWHGGTVNFKRFVNLLICVVMSINSPGYQFVNRDCMKERVSVSIDTIMNDDVL